jgi:hypothetical protein
VGHSQPALAEMDYDRCSKGAATEAAKLRIKLNKSKQYFLIFLQVFSIKI